MTTTRRVCDVCSAREPLRLIEVRTFEMEAVPGPPRHRSIGAWVACRRCAAVIDSGDVPGLVARALAAFADELDAAAQETAGAMLTLTYQQLMTNRLGPSQDLDAFVRACPHPDYVRAHSVVSGTGRFCVRCGEQLV